MDKQLMLDWVKENEYENETGTMVIESDKLVLELEQMKTNELQQFAKDVFYIMSFHAGRCPLNPETNFSGSEEHLFMYRKIMKKAKELSTSTELKELAND